MNDFNNQTIVLIGTMTQSAPFCPNAAGDGVVAFSLDPRTGHLQRRGQFRDILNPSYLAWVKGESRLYAAEADFDTPGRVLALDFTPSGHFSIADWQTLNGSVTCHVCMLPGNTGICIASYMKSCIDSFEIRAGKMIPPARTHRYSGSGPNAARQEASHAHQAIVDPAGRRLYVCDLGSDCIWIHDLTGGMPAGNPTSAKVPAGYGPRHMAFHPTLPLAYVLCELGGQVLTYSWDARSGQLSLIAEIPGLPSDWSGIPAAAAIHVHPGGRTLYASQRTHDSMAVFKLDREGKPALVTHISSGGRDPRDFDFDSTGHWLIIANQTSNNLTVFEIDPATGLPNGSPPQKFAEGSPVCVVCTDRPADAQSSMATRGA